MTQHRIYYTITGYIDITLTSDRNDPEAACDFVEHMKLTDLVMSSKDVTVECEYEAPPEPEYEHEDKIEKDRGFHD